LTGGKGIREVCEEEEEEEVWGGRYRTPWDLSLGSWFCQRRFDDVKAEERHTHIE
jgi:hypothetical protein